MFRPAVKRHFLVVFGSAFLLAGCFPSPDSNADEQRDPHYLNGRRRAESKDMQGAIEEFEKAVEVNPRNASAHFELGVLYENYVKDYATAYYHYQRHLQLRPPNSENAEKARERMNVCRRDLAGSEFLPPTTQMIQKQLDLLALENRNLKQDKTILQQENAVLQKQMSERRVPPPRGNTAAPVSRSPAGTAAEPPVDRSPSTNLLKAIAPQPPPSTQTQDYVVVSGDTMEKIARRFKLKVAKLEAANPGVEARRLRVGQRLVIPVP